MADDGGAHARGASGRELAVLVAVAVALVVGVAVAVAVGDDDSAASGPTDLAWVRAGCQQWADGAGDDRPEQEWCESMAGWMAGQATGPMREGAHGHGGMAAAAMWADPGSLQATCEQWAASGSGPPAGGADAGARCEEMAGWMSGHMGPWGGR